MLVIADAGPLIGFAKAGMLPILRALFTTLQIPPAVLQELQIAENGPGAQALRVAIEDEGWIVSVAVERSRAEATLSAVLDPGETEAILLAMAAVANGEEVILLIDERRGRRVATHHEICVVGSGRVLLAVKEHHLIPLVSEALTAMARSGYRLSSHLQETILALAGE
ncbi:MAG: hypothetical protein ACYTGH_19745 [Planctomycetota bacterium]|jgi:predicted nucleic acid-binding protein